MIDLTFNGKDLGFNGKNLAYDNSGPVLPPFTIRCRFTEGVTPGYTRGTWTQVSVSPNIWDLTYENTDWTEILSFQTDLVEVLDANTTGVTNMEGMFNDCRGNLVSVAWFDTSECTDMSMMFYHCNSLTSVPLYNTSNCTSMGRMFHQCASLTTVPLFNTSNCKDMVTMFGSCTSLISVPLLDTTSCLTMASMFHSCTSLQSVPLFNTSSVNNMDTMFTNCTSLISVPLLDTSRVRNMNYMFYNCYNVQSGALALYRQASTQATPPSSHTATFTNCGSNTSTGKAELAQIPQDWGGTMD